jgi:hypothetical protein
MYTKKTEINQNPKRIAFLLRRNVISVDGIRRPCAARGRWHATPLYHDQSSLSRTVVDVEKDAAT